MPQLPMQAGRPVAGYFPAWRCATTRAMRRAVAAPLCALALLPTAAVAHGGLSIDKDVCKMQVGPYALHFTGYQPEATGSREFCEDIPATGPTVVVLDAIDSELRRMPIEVRILRDSGQQNDLSGTTVLHLPPKLYPTGSVSFDHRFDEPGKFIGLVLVGEKGQHVSRFPFSVASSRPAYEHYLLLAAAPLLGFALYRYSGRARAAAAPRPAPPGNGP